MICYIKYFLSWREAKDIGTPRIDRVGYCNRLDSTIFWSVKLKEVSSDDNMNRICEFLSLRDS